MSQRSLAIKKHFCGVAPHEKPTSTRVGYFFSVLHKKLRSEIFGNKKLTYVFISEF